MKDTNELRSFTGSGFNAGADILKDGKVRGDDLPKIIGTALKASPAFEGIGQVDNELAKATVAERNASDQVFGAELTNFSEDDKRDMIAIENGIYGGIAIISRKAYQRGQKDATDALIAKLEAGISLAEIKANL